MYVWHLYTQSYIWPALLLSSYQMRNISSNNARENEDIQAR